MESLWHSCALCYDFWYLDSLTNQSVSVDGNHIYIVCCVGSTTIPLFIYFISNLFHFKWTVPSAIWRIKGKNYEDWWCFKKNIQIKRFESQSCLWQLPTNCLTPGSHQHYLVPSFLPNSSNKTMFTSQGRLWELKETMNTRVENSNRSWAGNSNE